MENKFCKEKGGKSKFQLPIGTEVLLYVLQASLLAQKKIPGTSTAPQVPKKPLHAREPPGAAACP